MKEADKTGPEAVQAKGRWFVGTRDSTYMIDSDLRTIARVTVKGPLLRLDGMPIPLLRVTRCRVGEEMELLIDVVQDGKTTTVRRTSPVRYIRPA